MTLKLMCGKRAITDLATKDVLLTLILFRSGIYCLLAVATMLNIMTPELVAGLPEFIISCQTYEGGFGNASFPGWAFSGEYVSTCVCLTPDLPNNPSITRRGTDRPHRTAPAAR